MKRALLLLLLLLPAHAFATSCSNNAVGSFTCVQSTSAVITGTTTFVLQLTGVTSGSMVLGIAHNSSSGATLTCTDNNSGSYTTNLNAADTTDNDAVSVCSAPNHASGNVSVTFSTAATTMDYVSVYEYSGVASSTPFDVQSNRVDFQNNGAYDSGTTATLAQAHELVIGVANDGGGTGTLSAGSGFNTRETGTIATHGILTEDKDSGTGTAGVKATFSNTLNFDNTLMLVVTYQPTSGGGFVARASKRDKLRKLGVLP